MKKLWAIIGRISYIFASPALDVLLNDTQRTRLIVKKDDKILVVKDWLGDGAWKLPGGGIKKSENIATSACRELYEETGVPVEPSSLQSFGLLSIKKKRTKSNLHVFGVTFTNDFVAPKRKFKMHNLEIIDIAWLTVEQLMSSRISDNTRSIITKFNNLF